MVSSLSSVALCLFVLCSSVHDASASLRGLKFGYITPDPPTPAPTMDKTTMAPTASAPGYSIDGDSLCQNRGYYTESAVRPCCVYQMTPFESDETTLTSCADDGFEESIVYTGSSYIRQCISVSADADACSAIGGLYLELNCDWWSFMWSALQSEDVSSPYYATLGDDNADHTQDPECDWVVTDGSCSVPNCYGQSCKRISEVYDVPYADLQAYDGCRCLECDNSIRSESTSQKHEKMAKKLSMKDLREKHSEGIPVPSFTPSKKGDVANSNIVEFDGYIYFNPLPSFTELDSAADVCCSGGEPFCKP